MEIKNRIIEIKFLQNYILQEYFEMQIKFNFQDDSWKVLLAKELKNYKNKDINRKLALKRDNYSVSDMDTSLLVNLLKNREGAFKCCRIYNMDECLLNIQEDRNIDAHSTSNESDSELIQWVYGSLYDLKKFLNHIYDFGNKLGKNRISYVRKYASQIDTLQKLFEQDYIEGLKRDHKIDEIQDEINTIQRSASPSAAFHDIYMQKYFPTHDIELIKQFCIIAADADIPLACSYAADLLFNNSEYFMAEKYYDKIFNQLEPYQLLNLVNIYTNSLSASHTKEEGFELLKKCEISRYKIIKYHTMNGYDFYGYEKLIPKNKQKSDE